MTPREIEKLRADPNAFHQQVRMAAVQVSGLRPEELTMALAYEVEPFSGIPAEKAELVYTPVVDPDPTVRVFDVVERLRVSQKGAKVSASRLLGFLIVLGGLAMLVAGADCAWMVWKKGRLTHEVDVRGALQAELDGLRSKATAQQNRAREIRQAREAAIAAQEAVARARVAMPELLGILRVTLNQQAALRRLSAEGPFALRVEALGATSEAVGAASVALSRQAGEKGWKVDLGALETEDEGATVRFSAVLRKELP